MLWKTVFAKEAILLNRENILQGILMQIYTDITW